jgi:cytochrome c oxidase assembly factor 6
MSGAPSKQEREICWNARDFYYKCLDNTNNNSEKCKSLREEYEKNCSKTWV